MSKLIKPTIIVGCGGIGAKVVESLYDEFSDVYKDIPDVIQLIAFDVDKNIKKIQNRHNLEICHLKVEHPDEYLVGINSGIYAEIEKWFSTDQITRIGDLSDGAQQIRQLGRLAAVLNMVQIREILDRKISLVRNIRIRSELANRGFSIKDNLNVIIVNSLGGGSGSGIFLDIAFNVRTLLKDNDSLIGYSITPQAFDMSSDKRLLIEANSFAACKELDYFMEVSNSFEYDYFCRGI